MRKTIEIDRETARALMGAMDCNLRKVRETFGVKVFAREELLHVEGESGPVSKSVRAFHDMMRIIRKSNYLQKADVERIVGAIAAEETHVVARPAAIIDYSEIAPPAPTAKSVESTRPVIPSRVIVGADDDNFDEVEEQSAAPAGVPSTEGAGKKASRVKPMSAGQRSYLDAIKHHDIVFASGPAGSGKTYLAVASAVEALSAGRVNRIVLVRPAVEAGERLGFLPGDMNDKVNPYLRPIYDALHDLLPPRQLSYFTEQGMIEIAPLAFMRGRTLNSAFVILDEAQNTTPKQMKMFLTRLGRGARAVITGDTTQVDLPDGDMSGLAHAQRVLKDVEGVSFVLLEKQDIVRHQLVQRIVLAYERIEASTL